MQFQHDIIYNNQKYYLLIGLTFAVILTSVALVYHQCRVRRSAYKTALSVLYSTILTVQTGQFLTIISPPATLGFFAVIQTIGFGFLGTAFFLSAYTLYKNHFPGRFFCIMLSLFPVLSMVMVLTNDHHHLVFIVRQHLFILYGQAFNLIIWYNLFCLLSGGLLLFFYFQKDRASSLLSKTPYYTGITFITALTVYQTLHPRHNHYDLIPVAMAVVQLMFYLGNHLMTKIGFFFTGGRELLDCIEESVIITDNHNNILYTNTSGFNQLTGVTRFNHMSPFLAEITEHASGNQSTKTLVLTLKNPLPRVVRGELLLSYKEEQYYAYHVHPLQKGKKNIVGKIYIFKDITSYQSLINQLHTKNLELTATNETLQIHTRVVQHLARENERRRIMNQMSETIGESMNQIVKLLEDLHWSTPIPPEEKAHFQSRIGKAIACARDGLGRVRKYVSISKKYEHQEQ